MVQTSLPKLAEIGSAAVFLTRLPVPQSLFKSHFPSLQQSLWAFPLIGLIIGAIGSGAYGLSLILGLSNWLSAIFAITAMVIATGGLHEDGLADLADGFGSHKGPEEIARIMKDSVIGSYGTLALILMISAKISVIASVPFSALIFLLPFACAIGRSFVIIAMMTTPLSPYASLGKSLSKPDVSVFIPALIIACIGAITLPVGSFLSGIIAAFIAFIILRNLAMRKIQGLTGDVMGALIILTELSFMIGFISHG
ncbi:MAG: adenosylcobinamide-GDP ribazoletransferase [Candidatus Puniceispirillaceae bacterium]